MTVQALAPRDIQTTLNYYEPKDDAEIPYHYVGEAPAGVPPSNVNTKPHAAVIHDARDKQDTLGLDVSGFQWETYPSVEKEFVDEEQIRTVYYAEVEDVVKKYTGGKKVFVFDHTMRKGGDRTESTARRPASLVHADQTPAAAEQRVRRHLPDDAERLLKHRYRIINVWRPIANTVAHEPLAFADFRSVNVEADLVALRLIYPHFEGQTFSVKYNPGHQWYYLPDQTPDQVALIKCFDSDPDKALLAPHSAFSDETSPADAPHRQSIEVRALVFDSE